MKKKRTNIIDFDKHRQAMTRPKDCAASTMRAIESDASYVFIPPATDHFDEMSAEEMDKILYESALPRGDITDWTDD